MKLGLKGRRAFITGASRGIGAEIARASGGGRRERRTVRARSRALQGSRAGVGATPAEDRRWPLPARPRTAGNVESDDRQGCQAAGWLRHSGQLRRRRLSRPPRRYSRQRVGNVLPGQAARPDPRDARLPAAVAAVDAGTRHQHRRHAGPRAERVLGHVFTAESCDARHYQGAGERAGTAGHHGECDQSRLDRHRALDGARPR